MISGDFLNDTVLFFYKWWTWTCVRIYVLATIKSPVVWALSVPSEGSHNCPSSVKHSCGLTSDLKGLNKEQKTNKTHSNTQSSNGNVAHSEHSRAKMWLWQIKFDLLDYSKDYETWCLWSFSTHCWNEEVINFNCIDVQEFRIDYWQDGQ